MSGVDWVADAIFYQIFPDRFARSERLAKPRNLEPWDAPPTIHGFKGGDLLGVAERLDTLVELGVTALYLNPVFQSAANHRYHTYDYYEIDPLLGGDEAFETLLAEAHRRGVRVILDGVFNHASRGFYQFYHTLENERASPYLDWFVFKSFPVRAYDESKEPSYAAWWNLHALPKFNFASEEVREFLLGVATHWIERGIDGWRLDVPEEIDSEAFWTEFRRRVKAVDESAYLVGEIWHPAPEWLRGDRFDAVMNYPLARALLGYVPVEPVPEELVRGMGYAPIPRLDGPGLADELDRLFSLYRWETTLVQLNLLGSHDTARVKTLCRGDAAALRLAFGLLLTLPGAPCLYYGDEIGMEGGRDPDCRRSFPWEPSRWDRALRSFVARTIALRRRSAALRRGDYRRLYAAGGVLAFRRALGEETVVVVANAGRRAERIVLRGVGRRERRRWEEALSGAVAERAEDGALVLEAPARSIGIWVEEEA